jgi:hypothetical protein
MKKIIRLTESDLARIVTRIINEATGEPDWLDYAAKQYMSIQPNIKPTNKQVRTTATYAATIPDVSFVYIIPNGSTFVPTPTGKFLQTKAYRVEKDKLTEMGIDWIKDNQGLSNALKGGKLGATASNIAGTMDGTILYPEGGSPLNLAGNSSGLSTQLKGAWA